MRLGDQENSKTRCIVTDFHLTKEAVDGHHTASAQWLPLKHSISWPTKNAYPEQAKL